MQTSLTSQKFLFFFFLKSELVLNSSRSAESPGLSRQKKNLTSTAHSLAAVRRLYKYQLWGGAAGRRQRERERERERPTSIKHYLSATALFDSRFLYFMFLKRFRGVDVLHSSRARRARKGREGRKEGKKKKKNRSYHGPISQRFPSRNCSWRGRKTCHIKSLFRFIPRYICWNPVKVDFRGSYLVSRRLSDASPVGTPGWRSLPDSLCKLPCTPLLFPRDQSEKHHTLVVSYLCSIRGDRYWRSWRLSMAAVNCFALFSDESGTSTFCHLCRWCRPTSRLGPCSQAPGAPSVLRWGAAATPVTTAVHLWCSVIWLIMLWCILRSRCVCFVNLLFSPRLFLPSWLGFVFREWSCDVMVILQFCSCLFPCSIMSLILSLTPCCCSQS